MTTASDTPMSYIPPGEPPEENLTVAEVARRLKVSIQTVYVLIDEGKLGGIKLGPRTMRIPVSEYEAFKKRASVSPPNKSD